ncbi:MAG: glycosyltransferase family 4 protein [Balneolaceae bacterium]
MRVGYVAPASIAAVNGGIRVQALNTIEQIKALGVEPVLLSPWQKLEEQNIDLIHIFGATVENVGISDQLKGLKIPTVLSPVFYSNHGSSFIKNALRLEKLSSVLGTGIRSDFSVKAQLCGQSNMILPNTSEEARLIEDGFLIPQNKIHVVPNGVEERFADADPALFSEKYKLKDFVLFVGQAGAPRKNVMNLLKAAEEIEAPVVIIGSFYKDNYGLRCKQLALKNDHVHLIESIEHNSEMLSSAYAASKVFVLPSRYETPGIAALEAALAGANIVITKNGGTKDYFTSHAVYIDPDSLSSLSEGINKSLKKEKDDLLKQHILTNYTWNKVAQQTVAHYKTLVS